MGAAIPALVIGAAGVAGKILPSIISSRNERKAAESAAASQERIAAQQIQAAKDAEKDAQKTAEAQRRAALARKSNTILSTPLSNELDDEQTNQPTILGVPQ